MSDVREWMTAVATVAGSLATAVALIMTYLLLRREAARDRDTEELRRKARGDEERSQAALVSAWFGRQMRTETGEAIPRGFHRNLGVHIRNASELPVYDVSIWFIRLPLPDKRTGLYDHAAQLSVGVVPPTSDPMFVEAPAAMIEGLGGEAEGQFVVALTFTDGAGWRWRRNPWGQLRRPFSETPSTVEYT